MSAQFDPSLSLFPQTQPVPAAVQLTPPPVGLLGLPTNPYTAPVGTPATPTTPDSSNTTPPPSQPEKAGMWASFLQHIQNNPDLGQALLTYAANASRAPRLGETPFSVMAGAANDAYGSYKGSQQMRALAALQAQKTKNETTTANAATTTAAAAKEKADADAAQTTWQQKADQIKLDLEAGKYKSEEDEAKARSEYLRAQATALGQDSGGESGALASFTQKIADAAVASGKFTDKNAAYLWAADNTLHRQGQTQQQWLQSLFTNSIKSEMEMNPGEDPSVAADNATKLVKYIQGNKAIMSSFNDLFAPPAAPTQQSTTTAPQPTAGSAAPPDVETRFKADPSMPPGSTLGPFDTGKGFQVLGPNGTVIGHYY